MLATYYMRHIRDVVKPKLMETQDIFFEIRVTVPVYSNLKASVYGSLGVSQLIILVLPDGTRS